MFMFLHFITLNYLFQMLGSYFVNITKGKIIGRNEFFVLNAGVNSNNTGIYLITNDVYFSTGYDQLLKHAHARSLMTGFNIQVRALVKILSIEKNSHYPLLCVPLIIEKIK